MKRRKGKYIKRTPPWYVVLNMVRTGTNIASEFANEVLPETWPHNVISNQVIERVVYQTTMAEGLTVSEVEPDGPAIPHSWLLEPQVP